MSKSKFKEAKEKRLRILHIAGWYPSENNPVAGIFVKEHVKATALYSDVVVLYSEGVAKRIREIYQVKENVEDGIRTLRVYYRKSPIPKTSYLVYLWSMFQAFSRLMKEGFRPDVIHAHIYSAGVPAVLIGKRYRIPVVITEQFTGFPRGLVRGLERLKAKFAFERAAVVCPVSDYLRKHIEQLGIKARFQVIPNVVDTSLFFPPDASPLRPDGKKRLLTVALLTPKKGIPYLLEALARLKEKRADFVLDIVGDGPNKQEYEQLTETLGLSDVVQFHGLLQTKPEVAKFMRQCDIFVLPSLVETFGAVLIEAIACGKPVVATDSGGPKEIITDEVGRLVPPGDPDALAKALDYMLDHAEDYPSQRIAEYARERYSYQVVGKELERVYKAIWKGASDEQW